MKVWHLLVIGIVTVGLYLFLLVFVLPTSVTYLVKNTTVEQVEQMVEANPDGGVWYQSINLLVPGSNLLEVTFSSRYLEKDRITEYLDSIGVQYSEIK